MFYPSQVLATVFFVLTNLWLDVWTGDDIDLDESSGIDETNLYLGVYAGLGVLSAIMLLILSIVLAITTLNASLRMHQNMLQVCKPTRLFTGIIFYHKIWIQNNVTVQADPSA